MDTTQSNFLPWAMPVCFFTEEPVYYITYREFVLNLACFLSALQLAAGQTGKTEMARNATVHTQVHLGKPKGMDGFGLEVQVQVEGIEDQSLIDAGHAVSLFLPEHPSSCSRTGLGLPV